MNTKISSLSIILLLTLAPIPLSFAQTTTTSSSSSSNGCIDLTQYATTDDGYNNMDILMNGGKIPNNAPVFFDIPSQFVTSFQELDFCLQNMTIPSYVGDNNCNVDKAQQCWIAVGLFAGDTTTHDSTTTTDSCINSDGDTNGCYECTCTGSSMGSGIATENEAISQGCGLQTDTRWGMSCNDVTNGRYNWVENDTTRIESNHSHVKVSICPSNVANCNICQGGGLHPSFRIGVQWISNLQEQCFDHPFGSSSCTDGLSTSSIIGIAVGSVLLLGVLLIVVFYLFNNKRRNIRSNNNSLLRQTNNNNTTTKSTKTNNNDDDDIPPPATTASTTNVPIVDESSMKTDEDSN